MVVECCPYCGEENEFEWNVEKDGYIAVCKCGEKMFLCDECFHAEDNPNMECDWMETENGRKCKRGVIKVADELQL